jgi:hypothetical protein
VSVSPVENTFGTHFSGPEVGSFADCADGFAGFGTSAVAGRSLTEADGRVTSVTEGVFPPPDESTVTCLGAGVCLHALRETVANTTNFVRPFDTMGVLIMVRIREPR